MIAELPRLLAEYGPWLIMAATCLGAFGLPSPASLTLVAAGAFSALGGLDFALVVASGIGGTILGDHLAYALARKASTPLRRFGPLNRLDRAERLIDRWGSLGVFGSRWIFPTVLTPTVNYAAGISLLPLRRFTPAVFLGETVYVLAYSGLGRLFSAQVQQVHKVANTASLLFLVIVIAAACLAILVRAIWRKE